MPRGRTQGEPQKPCWGEQSPAPMSLRSSWIRGQDLLPGWGVPSTPSRAPRPAWDFVSHVPGSQDPPRQQGRIWPQTLAGQSQVWDGAGSTGKGINPETWGMGHDWGPSLLSAPSLLSTFSSAKQICSAQGNLATGVPAPISKWGSSISRAPQTPPGSHHPAVNGALTQTSTHSGFVRRGGQLRLPLLPILPARGWELG